MKPHKKSQELSKCCNARIVKANSGFPLFEAPMCNACGKLTKLYGMERSVGIVPPKIHDYRKGCTCAFSIDTTREIGHSSYCPLKDEKTWWQKEKESQELMKETLETPPIPNVSNDWKKEIIGKNIHSVYTLCPECHTWGVNMPLYRVCGDCSYPDGIVYYDEETIEQLLEKQKRELERNFITIIDSFKKHGYWGQIQDQLLDEIKRKILNQ